MNLAKVACINTVALAVLLGLGSFLSQPAQAQTFTLLYTFPDYSGVDVHGVVRDKSGNLYGTTKQGGTHNDGLVFKVGSSGNETTLYNFTWNNGDGAYPYPGVIRDGADNLYGTTNTGGNQSYCAGSGCGTVFKVDTTGAETVLYSFTGGSDGQYPFAGVIMDKAGNLYGTTYSGGNVNCQAPLGCGTVFQLSPSQGGTYTETVLHRFAGGAKDGAVPSNGSLLRDSKGNLYGVTVFGGSGGTGCGGNRTGCGTVFRLSKSGMLKVLYSFVGGTTDGCFPIGALAMSAKGDIYGTTPLCGSSGDGIVWKLSKKRVETVLHSFCGGASDGAVPWAGVILGAKGNLYGDTQKGGGCQGTCGTVFKLSESGTLTLLHSFDGLDDGDSPTSPLIRDAAGNLYGTTEGGGPPNGQGYGTVWKITP